MATSAFRNSSSARAPADVGLVCAWLDELMTGYQENPQIEMEAAIKKCSKTHYDALNMDDVLEPFLGRPEAFYSFLQEKWNWIVTVDEDGKRIFADENKAQCICPLIRAGAVHTPNLCNCSEGFAERMFTKVFERPVKARVIESVLRGGRHCVYEIMIE
jgi:hypothetical protein